MRYIGLCVVTFIAFMVCSCGSDADMLPNQRENISKYLESKDLGYTMQDGVYKHIANSSRPGYENATVANLGDSVTYRFEAYVFTSSPEQLYYTNKPNIIDTLAKRGLNTAYWSKMPAKMKVGSTELIKGLANGIPYSRKGDSVVLFFTSDMAYDKYSIGTVPSNSAVMYVINIDNVKK